MDCLERRNMLNFLWFGLDFERSRQEFIDLNHRGFRQWVRQSPEHNRQALRDARTAAPEGLVPFCEALRGHFPVYAHFLAAADERDLIDV